MQAACKQAVAMAAGQPPLLRCPGCLKALRLQGDASGRMDPHGIRQLVFGGSELTNLFGGAGQGGQLLASNRVPKGTMHRGPGSFLLSAARLLEPCCGRS
jgi:hypothetical protein